MLKKRDYKSSSKVHEAKRQPEKKELFKSLQSDNDPRSTEDKLKDRSCINGECGTYFNRSYPDCNMIQCGIYKLLKYREDHKNDINRRPSRYAN